MCSGDGTVIPERALTAADDPPCPRCGTPQKFVVCIKCCPPPTVEGQRIADGLFMPKPSSIDHSLATVTRQRDEAERLLAAMVTAWDGESMRDDQDARDEAHAYLATRGKVQA